MNGFLYGRGTAEALTAYHTHSKSRYLVFLDFKSAFNKANVDVILYNLGKFIKGKILNIAKDFLSLRKIEDFSQGKLSEEKCLDLGKPQPSLTFL